LLVTLEYASAATSSAFSQSPDSAPRATEASDFRIAQRPLVWTTTERDDVRAEVAEAVVRASVFDHGGGAPELPRVRLPVEAATDLSELDDAPRRKACQPLLEQLRLPSGVVPGGGARLCDQSPERRFVDRSGRRVSLRWCGRRRQYRRQSVLERGRRRARHARPCAAIGEDDKGHEPERRAGDDE
jgi:hypothetical protein